MVFSRKKVIQCWSEISRTASSNLLKRSPPTTGRNGRAYCPENQGVRMATELQESQSQILQAWGDPVMTASVTSNGLCQPKIRFIP